MSNYLAHAIGVKATHNLPIQSDVMSPKGRYVKNDDCIHVYWMLNGRWSEDTTISKYHRQPNGDYVFDGVSVELFKDTIKRQGNFECNQRNIRALWDDARLTQMARNMLNQAQSALAQISNQLNMRHSAIPEDVDVIDVSDTLQHAQHEGYYSPNNTANKATPYIFEKIVKSSAGNQIGARFKGQGDRQWVEIFVPTVDFTPNMQNFIALFNAEKGNVKIREEEMRKAARILTNFFNSPSLPGNEKMTTYVRKPKSLKHALFTEVYDMDEYLEHHGILGMKWGVRRYQNKDGSLTAEGRKHYNVKTVNSTRMELAGAESDREKRTILTKATNKAMGDQAKGMIAGMGSMVAADLAKQAVAKAAAGTIVRDLVYNSLTGTSSLVTSVIPAAVPAWAAALTTPVGQIALAAVGTAGAAKAIYGAYKTFKLNELAAEFDVSTNVNRIVREQTSVNSAIERGMQEYYRKLDSEEMDKAAHKEASKYGLDQADNYKVFRDALIGDEKAQQIVDEWKRNR